MPNIKLYHGTTAKFDKIDLSKSKTRLDFGEGFYVTTDRNQAVTWAKRQQRIALSEGFGSDSLVYSYLVDVADLRSLNILYFQTANRDWLEYVITNRKGKGIARDYDVVRGRVADARTGLVLNKFNAQYRNYSFSEIPDAAVKNVLMLLKVDSLCDQLCFKTEHSIDVLCKNECVRSIA